MNFKTMLAQSGSLPAGSIAVAIIVVVVVIGLLLLFLAKRYKMVGPNQVLIVSGRKHKAQDAEGNVTQRGFRVVKGGGTFVMPVVEQVAFLSLELLTIDVQTPEVYTSKGVPVKVDGVAQRRKKGRERVEFN